MPVRSIAEGETLGLRRGDVAIWIPGGGEGEGLQSVLQHTAARVPVLTEGDVLAASHPADVVLLEGDCVVRPGWLESLRAAAYCDSNVATASALSAVRPSLGLHPRIERPAGGCVYVRRSAIELAGSPGSSRFAARCSELGFVHLLADDVAVQSARQDLPGDEEPLRRTLGAARRAASGLSLVIDARGAGPRAAGTQRHIVELVGALRRAGQERITVVGQDAIPGVRVIGESEAMRAPGDVVHRPLQVFGDWQLRTLPRMGQRTIITHHDLIAYRNPSYSPSCDAWLDFRRHTRLALALADHVVFPSGHAREDALVEGLVEPGRASVIANGVDHHDGVAPVAPAGLAASEPFVLCLGANYHHKNRAFALRIAQHLPGWGGRVVFAGPSVAHGSSAAEEAQLLDGDPQLAARVLDLGRVGDGERSWLLRHAALVLYPTVYEGFGFIPFEAAAFGVPCLWAPSTSLAQLLGAQEAPIVMWDAAASAARAAELLRDRTAAERNIARIAQASAHLTWDAAARALLTLYDETCARSPSPAAIYAALGAEAALTEDALRLVGPGGALAPDLQRPLLALATHPQVARPVLGAIKAGYRFSRAAQRLRGRGR